MNIYAIKGHKVRVKTYDAGYEYQEKLIRDNLKLGEEYTILRTEVASSYTEVFLEEFPDISFNSVFFEDVVTQSEEDDMKHQDFSKYNY